MGCHYFRGRGALPQYQPLPPPQRRIGQEASKKGAQISLGDILASVRVLLETPNRLQAGLSTKGKNIRSENMMKSRRSLWIVWQPLRFSTSVVSSERGGGKWLPGDGDDGRLPAVFVSGVVKSQASLSIEAKSSSAYRRQSAQHCKARARGFSENQVLTFLRQRMANGKPSPLFSCSSSCPW